MPKKRARNTEPLPSDQFAQRGNSKLALAVAVLAAKHPTAVRRRNQAIAIESARAAQALRLPAPVNLDYWHGHCRNNNCLQCLHAIVTAYSKP